jgi:hypothetical protein
MSLTQVPESVRDAFYAGRRGPRLPLCINDSVEVVSGEHAGRGGAVISIESGGNDPTYLVEFGDTGADALLVASVLRLIEEGSA